MKKILSCVMALSIAACTVLSASAATAITSGGDSSGTATVSTNRAPAYTVTIPDNKVIQSAELSGNVVLGNVEASDVVIGDTDNLTVTIKSANSFAMKCDDGKGDHSISYKVETETNSGTDLTDGATVLTVKGGSSSGTETLTIKDINTGSAACAGNYLDTLTFTVAVGPAGA